MGDAAGRLVPSNGEMSGRVAAAEAEIAQLRAALARLADEKEAAGSDPL